MILKVVLFFQMSFFFFLIRTTQIRNAQPLTVNVNDMYNIVIGVN